MLLHDLESFNIILASASARRKELLGMMNLKFSVADSYDVEEVYPDSISNEDAPWYISKLKSEGYPLPLADNDILITADTLVIIGNKSYGKPKDRNEAILMLSHLSGNTHKVITGVTLKNPKYKQSFSSVTEVTFKALRQDEIEYYIDTFKPYDKAGAYAVQEWIGLIGVDMIKGSYYNIMGLPTDSLFRQLSLFSNKLKTQ